MKVPGRVLEKLRATALAAAMAGCSSAPAASPAAEVEPEPITPTTRPAPDPVAYDAETEAERLARLDTTLAAAERRRGRRVADEERAQRDAIWETLGGIGRGSDRWIGAGCGRG